MESHGPQSSLPQLVYEIVSCLHLFLEGGLPATAPTLNQPRGDQQGFTLAKAWKLDISVHIVRKQEYRGRSSAVDTDRLRLNFDGMTTAGAIFAVPCLQSRPNPELPTLNPKHRTLLRVLVARSALVCKCVAASLTYRRHRSSLLKSSLAAASQRMQTWTCCRVKLNVICLS